MDFNFGEKEKRLRMEIREFVKKEIPEDHVGGLFAEEHLDEDWEFAMSIAKKLAEKRWLTMAWPEEYGGLGASLWEQAVYTEAVGYWGIPGTSMGISGVGWVGPSLMLYGTEEQKKKYMPLIAAGEPDGVWCTGYSEPNAGSDFANIKTRAEKKGDEYIINGQKVWTSAAHRSRWCWLAVKTDVNVSKKYHGISIIMVDMKSKGVNVRPILNYVGYHIFNEVFFDDVHVPVENLVGQENKGWYQLMHSLGFERGSVAIGAYGANSRAFDELLEYAKEAGLFKRSDIRHEFAGLAVDIEVQKIMAYETIAKMAKGGTPIYEPSRDKAYNDVLMEKMTIFGTQLIGPYSQLDILDKNSKWARLKGRIERGYWMFLGLSIAAGTTDNQRNIIGQFALNLPKSY